MLCVVVSPRRTTLHVTQLARLRDVCLDVRDCCEQRHVFFCYSPSVDVARSGKSCRGDEGDEAGVFCSVTWREEMAEEDPV